MISWNISPDIGFDRAVNPYRGCEHGCVYCYARPTHAYLGYSPGLDFETKLVFKPDVGALLERELRRPGYECKPIALGSNTDPYQPVERTLKLTRAVLEVLERYGHPVSIVTKSAGEARAGYVLLRLPLELRDMFEAWLGEHYPDRARHVLSLVRETRAGALNDSKFHARFTGQGPYAELLGKRFTRAARQWGFEDRTALETRHFTVPSIGEKVEVPQLSLF